MKAALLLKINHTNHLILIDTQNLSLSNKTGVQPYSKYYLQTLEFNHLAAYIILTNETGVHQKQCRRT